MTVHRHHTRFWIKYWKQLPISDLTMSETVCMLPPSCSGQARNRFLILFLLTRCGRDGEFCHWINDKKTFNKSQFYMFIKQHWASTPETLRYTTLLNIIVGVWIQTPAIQRCNTSFLGLQLAENLQATCSSCKKLVLQLYCACADRFKPWMLNICYTQPRNERVIVSEISRGEGRWRHVARRPIRTGRDDRRLLFLWGAYTVSYNTCRTTPDSWTVQASVDQERMLEVFSLLPSLMQLYTVCGEKKTPLNKYHYFIVQYFLTKFSEVILDTICHYCCKFYHLNFRCLEVAHFWM